MSSALQANAGIDQGVEDVDQQVDQHDHGAADDDDALDDREIAEGDALVEQPAEAASRIAERGDDGQLDPPASTGFDEEEWQW
jgi:hypothetical protein